MKINLKSVMCPVLCIMASSMNAFSFEPTVREDRIWEYSGCDVNGMHRYDDSSWNSLIAYHFVKFVEKKTVDGKEYSRLAVIRTRKYSTSDETNEFGPNALMSDEKKDKTLCWLREDSGIVYRLDDSYYMQPVHVIPDDADPGRFIETDIYNWNLNEGETIMLSLLGDAETDLKEEFIVHYLPPINVGETSCRVMTFADDDFVESVDGRFCIIEGVGASYNGHLGAYFLTLMTGTADNGETPGIQSSLERVYDGEGNLIYGEELPTPGAVGDIFKDNDNSNDTIFDVMGRRVSSTVPGSVYIRGGKKFVAK